MSDQIWSVRYPFAAATGVEFARGRLAPTDVLLVHAAPEAISVEVHDAETGGRLASGTDLLRVGTQTPMVRLVVEGSLVHRQDIWPREADLGTPVLLAGGEVGILESWWNAEDQRAWEWTIRLTNRIG
jgi:hypothetical protein